MEEEELQKPSYLSWSVGRAMIGEVTANLAGLYARLETKKVIVAGYFFIKPSEEDLEHFSDICGSIIADFPASYALDEQIGLISEVKRTSIHWNFLRAEVSPS